jgi:hypothetical protein
MQKTLSSLVTVLMLCWTGVASAEEVYLNCRIDRTYDYTDKKTSPTTGSNTYIIEYNKGKITQITPPYSCDDNTMYTNITDVEIFVSCDFSYEPEVINNRYSEINRIDGTYQNYFGINGKNGLLHTGICKKMEKQF